MRQRGLQPETVELPHNAAGHWIGNKNAKNVLVYYHGLHFSSLSTLPFYNSPFYIFRRS